MEEGYALLNFPSDCHLVVFLSIFISRPCPLPCYWGTPNTRFLFSLWNFCKCWNSTPPSPSLRHPFLLSSWLSWVSHHYSKCHFQRDKKSQLFSQYFLFQYLHKIKTEKIEWLIFLFKEWRRSCLNFSRTRQLLFTSSSSCGWQTNTTPFAATRPSPKNIGSAFFICTTSAFTLTITASVDSIPDWHF